VAANSVISSTDEGIPAARGGVRIWRLLRADPAFWVGAAGVALLLLFGLLAPVLALHPPDTQYSSQLAADGHPLGPSPAFPLGADALGRDELSRLLFGARTSVSIAVLASTLGAMIGLLVGSLAGLVAAVPMRVRLGRMRAAVSIPVEAVLMRLTDAVLALPVVLVALAVAALVQTSSAELIVLIAALVWAPTARVVHTRTAALRGQDFILAARATGVGNRRLLSRHLLPHLAPIGVVYATLGVANTIVLEATLSYLGVGVATPTASWGSMVYEHRNYLLDDPRLIFLPGLAIVAAVLVFNMLGDALADALDPSRWT
jgi:peptide/nickel transport system permease protein